MVSKLREALAESYGRMQLNYVIKLQKKYSDAIQDVLPFIYALGIRRAFNIKIIDHGLDLNLNKSQFCQLVGIVFEEING